MITRHKIRIINLSIAVYSGKSWVWKTLSKIFSVPFAYKYDSFYICTTLNERKKFNRLTAKNFILSFEDIGPVVQLVRIHACHAWGRGFESRPDRNKAPFLGAFCI
jgi:hypothetical protein